MKLNQLFELTDLPDIDIENIMYNSKEHLDNSLFFCLQGIRSDGHTYINQAIDNGAIAIVHSREIRSKKEGITYLYQPHLEKLFPKVVDRFFNHPSQKLKLIGITGTSGKTSIALLIYQLLNNQFKTGYLGDLLVEQSVLNEAHLTTKNLVINQRRLSQMVNDQIMICAMEISSQALELQRVEELVFDCAIFTNLTQDHLDFHLNMESYYQAKKKLFEKVSPLGFSLINIDDTYGQRLVKECQHRVITISETDKSASVYINKIEYYETESIFEFYYQQNHYHFVTNLLGHFNVLNLIFSMIVCHEYGLSLESISEFIKHIELIEGRNERIIHDGNFQIYIDFAKTISSYVEVMKFARNLAKNNARVITVFGADGSRDKEWRSNLGKIADEYSDLIILCEEDSKDEDPLEIINDIASSIMKHPYVKIVNRNEAIVNAIEVAQANDIILILGKGCDTTIHRFKEEKYPGDRQVILKALERRKEEFKDEEFEQIN